MRHPAEPEKGGTVPEDGRDSRARGTHRAEQGPPPVRRLLQGPRSEGRGPRAEQRGRRQQHEERFP